jgi:putative transcriptional regulator
MSHDGVDLFRAPIAAGSILVALPPLMDPNFHQTVLVLCSVNEEGVMALVVNRPTDLHLADALPEDELLKGQTSTVFEGGPVASDRILLLRKGEGQGPDFSPVFGETYLGGTMSGLKDAVTAQGIVGDYRPYIGHAGWSTGQLELEMEEGSWALLPPDEAVIFTLAPHLLWSQAMRQLGGSLAVYATMPPDIHLN